MNLVVIRFRDHYWLRIGSKCTLEDSAHAQQANSVAKQAQLILEIDQWRQHAEKLETEIAQLKTKPARETKTPATAKN